MLNHQPVEKRVKREDYDGTLDVHSIFYTIQGEGPFCGTPAVFIRLAGCNLQCPWCDTEYTAGRRPMGKFEILSEVNALLRADRWRQGLVVITGGEPLRQPIGELLVTLCNAGYYVQIETNGTLPPPDDISGGFYSFDFQARNGVYVVCSPKTGVINPRLHTVASCYKYVMDADNVDPEDGLPVTALGHVANPRLGRPPEDSFRPVYLQPADHQDPARNAANMAAVVASAMQHGYTVQLQIHKILNME